MMLHANTRFDYTMKEVTRESNLGEKVTSNYSY